MTRYRLVRHGKDRLIRIGSFTAIAPFNRIIFFKVRSGTTWLAYAELPQGITLRDPYQDVVRPSHPS